MHAKTEFTIAMTVEDIHVHQIYPSPLNRHSANDDQDVIELAQTIQENGLLSPISVRPRKDGRFEIIYGERRWRAYRRLERATIPCIVKDLDDTQAQIERIVENYQRRDPSFLEQGEAVAALMELTDRDVSEVANRLGQSISWVRRRAKLPNLIPAWREELAKENTPYYAIRDSVNKLEEIAVLPQDTQESLLASGALRYLKTTKEMRATIAKLFMDLDAKPWTRAWEKKAFSGSGKKRCDACMRRSDRENALFANPDDPSAGKKMCLDPQCWKNKCLAWCTSLINDTPGMVPIRQGYGWHEESRDALFGVKPVPRYEWQERDDSEAEKEGYTATIGVIIDGPDIGTTKAIWLSLPDDDESDVFEVNGWRTNQLNTFQMRRELAEIIAADITAYLADLDSHTTFAAGELEKNQLRAAAWLGIPGYVDAENEDASLDDPEWNPLEWIWNQAAGEIASHIATITAEGIAQLSNGDRDFSCDKATADTLVRMFNIPLDVIATRAEGELYATTDAQGQNKVPDKELVAANAPVFDDESPAVAGSAESFTDTDDFISIAEHPLYSIIGTRSTDQKNETVTRQDRQNFPS